MYLRGGPSDAGKLYQFLSVCVGRFYAVIGFSLPTARPDPLEIPMVLSAG